MRFGRKTYGWILLSYFSVVLVTLIFNVGFAAASNRTLEKEILSANGRALSQFRSLLDARLQEMENFAGQLAMDKDIQRLAVQQWAVKTSDYYYLTAQICDELKSMGVQNPLAGEIYIWFMQDGYLLTGRGRYEQEEYYEIIKELHIGLSFEDWRAINESVSVSGYQVLPVSDGQNRMVYLRNVITNAGWDKRAMVGVILNQDQLLSDILDSIWFKGGGICLLDEEGNCILSSDPAFSDWAQAYGNSNADGRAGILRFEGMDCYTREAYSLVNGWRYLSITPRKALMRPRDDMVKLSLILVGGALILTTLLCLFAARRQYAPLRRLVSALGGKDVKGSEYSFVEETVAHILDEKDNLRQALDEKVGYLRDSGLIQLLLERTLDECEAQELLEECGILLPHSGFHLICVHMIRPNGQENEQDWIVLRGILEEIFCRKKITHYLFKLRGRLMVLINAPESSEMTQNLYKAAQEMEQAMMAKGQDGLVAAISRAGTGLASLHTIYQQVAELDAYLSFLSHGGVAVYEESFDVNVTLAMRTGDDESRLYNLLAAGAYKQARQVMDEIVDQLLSPGDLSLIMLRYRTFKLLDTLARVMHGLIPTASRETLEIIQTSRWLQCENQDELRSVLDGLFERMIELLQMDDSRKGDQEFIERVVRLVGEMYASPELSVQTLAGRMGISQATLARGFKRNMNCGVLDYIHQYRIREAKKLMAQETYGVQEIAERTGFLNSVTFIRVFKKYEGITPGAFRRIQPPTREEEEE